MEQQKLHIDLKQTTPIKDSKGNQIWQEGVLLRKIPKFLIGAPQDGMYPIPIFYNTTTGEILKESVPKELHTELGLNEEKKKITTDY